MTVFAEFHIAPAADPEYRASRQLPFHCEIIRAKAVKPHGMLSQSVADKTNKFPNYCAFEMMVIPTALIDDDGARFAALFCADRSIAVAHHRIGATTLLIISPTPTIASSYLLIESFRLFAYSIFPISRWMSQSSVCRQEK